MKSKKKSRNITTYKLIIKQKVPKTITNNWPKIYERATKKFNSK